MAEFIEWFTKFAFILVLVALTVMFVMSIFANAQMIDEKTKITLKPLPIYDMISVTEPNYIQVVDNSQRICLANETAPCYNNIKNIVFNGYVKVSYPQKIKNILSPSGKIIDMPAIIDEKSNVISKFDYPIGSRNMKEYGRCRQYEIDKGVCHEI